MSATSTSGATHPATTFACGPTSIDCTPAQVIATVTQIYVLGGATPAQAACLAPITGQGKHAVNQAFESPSPAQTSAAIKCVGSEARLRTIGAGVAHYFRTHPNG